jgi:hypothetical protein
MNLRAASRHTGMRMALGALAVAVIVTVWTLVNALRVDAIPDAPPTTVASLQGGAGAKVRGRGDIQNVVDNDVFSADRSAPAAPYRMPGEPDPEKPTAMPEKPVLLGTVVASDNHNFATVTLRGDRPTLVHVGDKIGEWTVKAIERNKIVLVTASGARTELAVSKPGT